MSEIDSTSTEAQRLEVQEDASVEKFKDFFKSLLEWSLAFIGAKDFLRNNQAIFIAISIALMLLFGISWRARRSDRGMTFIYFAFLILGCLGVGIAIDSVVSNSYNKWVIYSMFLALVTTYPNHQHNYQEMKEIFKSICGATSLRLRNLFIQLLVIIENLFRTNIADREESPMNNNPETQPDGGNGDRVGQDNV